MKSEQAVSVLINHFINVSSGNLNRDDEMYLIVSTHVGIDGPDDKVDAEQFSRDVISIIDEKIAEGLSGPEVNYIERGLQHLRAA